MTPRHLLSAVTRAGWAALACGAAGYLLGWWLGWVELVVMAAGVALAFGLAALFVLGRFRLRLERAIEPERVAVGEPSLARLTVTNDRASPSPPVSVIDWIGEQAFPVDVPLLGPGGTKDVTYPLPTSRRGVVDVGPVMVVKRDPLGLLSRESRQGRRHRLRVHPTTARLPALPVGFAKDIEGPTSDANPKGDVAFHTLREYVPGDEYRHIHWKSTARLGSLMVRQYVDNRRPHLTVVLDTNPGVYDDATFEVAVSCAASLVVSSFLEGQSVSAYSGTTPVVGWHVAASADDVLDHFAEVGRAAVEEDLVRAAAVAVGRERATSATVVVTGALPADRIVALRAVLRSGARLMVVRAIGPGERALPRLAGVDVFNPASLGDFRSAWVRIAQ